MKFQGVSGMEMALIEANGIILNLMSLLSINYINLLQRFYIDLAYHEQIMKFRKIVKNVRFHDKFWQKIKDSAMVAEEKGNNCMCMAKRTL